MTGLGRIHQIEVHWLTFSMNSTKANKTCVRGLISFWEAFHDYNKSSSGTFFIVGGGERVVGASRILRV